MIFSETLFQITGPRPHGHVDQMKHKDFCETTIYKFLKPFSGSQILLHVHQGVVASHRRHPSAGPLLRAGPRLVHVVDGPLAQLSILQNLLHSLIPLHFDLDKGKKEVKMGKKWLRKNRPVLGRPCFELQKIQQSRKTTPVGLLPLQRPSSAFLSPLKK